MNESTSTRRNRSVTNALALVLLLAAVYIGSYWCILDPLLMVEEGMLGIVSRGHREPNYSFGGDAATLFFIPIHWCDRRLRPGYWEIR